PATDAGASVWIGVAPVVSILSQPLVDQEHDGVGSLALQFRGMRIRRVGLVEKRQIAADRGRHDLARAGERLADEADLHAADDLDNSRWEQRRARRRADDVRGEILEPRAVEAIAVQAAVLRVAAAPS